METYFIGVNFMEGQCLSTAWKAFSQCIRMTAAYQVVENVVKLGKTFFDGFSGSILYCTLRSTVEGMQIFKVKVGFPGLSPLVPCLRHLVLKTEVHIHTRSCHDTCPYQISSEYVLA